MNKLESFFKGDDYSPNGEPFGEPFGDEVKQMLGDLMGDEETIGSGDAIDDALRVVGDLLGEDITTDLIGDLNRTLQKNNIFANNSPLGRKLQQGITKMANQGQTNGVKKVATALNTLKQVPGGIGKALNYPPYVIKNGNMVRYNTRAVINGLHMENFIYRFESQLIGKSRTQTLQGLGLGIANKLSFDFTTPTNADELRYGGPILIIVRSSALNAIDDFDFQVQFGTAVTEAGVAYSTFDNIRVAVKRSNKAGENATYIYLFPFVEIATRLMPIALQASTPVPGSFSNLVIELVDVPTTYDAQVTLLAPDNKYWEDFKKAFGLKTASSGTLFN